MNVARILYPVQVLGPGKRIGLWFNGCGRRCSGCSNPELWEYQERYQVSGHVIETLVQNICTGNQVDGITLTGGDPFHQPEALRELLPFFNQISHDILVYTGFRFEEIREQYSDILSQIGVLIDGEYIEKLNSNLLLRGSSNQNIIALRPDLVEKYRNYLDTEKNKIQNFTTPDGVISVGIHAPTYEKTMDQLLKQRGLEQI